MSTISPAATQRMGAELEKKGVTLLDAPISGGQIGAIEGKLSIMMGGPAEMVEFLLANGAQPNRKNRNKLTPAEEAGKWKRGFIQDKGIYKMVAFFINLMYRNLY